jgi:hypothetical protein
LQGVVLVPLGICCGKYDSDSGVWSSEIAEAKSVDPSPSPSPQILANPHDIAVASDLPGQSKAIIINHTIMSSTHRRTFLSASDKALH